MQIITAIIGVLVGVIGILGGVLSAKNKENKILKNNVEKTQEVNSVNEQITDVVTGSPPKKNSVAKQNGILFIFLIFMLVTLYGCAGVKYEPVAPNLVIISYNTTPVSYGYNKESDVYTLDQANMDNLVHNITILEDTLLKYENQIKIYNTWRKKE